MVEGERVGQHVGGKSKSHFSSSSPLLLLCCNIIMSSTAEVFAAMGEAVAGDGGNALQRKFKVGPLNHHACSCPSVLTAAAALRMMK
jgi:hypothetical protein